MTMNPPEWVGRLGIAPYSVGEPVRKGLWWPERKAYSEWAVENVIVPDTVSSMPGPVSLDQFAYLREPLDAFGDPTIEEMTFKWCTQAGKTFLEALMLAGAAGQDPGPALFVMPDEQLAREFLEERFTPLLKASPSLRGELSKRPYDSTKTRVRLQRMNVWVAWATSPAKLASRAIRYLFFDETNKYWRRVREEGDPIKLGTERTKTYRFTRKIIKSSTPTVKEGYISREYERSDQREFYVPCPHCGEHQVLRFSQVTWPKLEDGSNPPFEKVYDEQSAYYLCVNCEGEIREEDKGRMISKGVWAPKGCAVNRDGEVEGERPRTKHAGFFINALYSPWISFSDMAAEFLESRKDAALLRNFVNSWLAEDFEDLTKTMELFTSDMGVDAADLTTLPEEPYVLTCGVDLGGSPGKEHCWYTVRAWCGEEESHLVEEGRFDVKELEEIDPRTGRNKKYTDLEQLQDELLNGVWEDPSGKQHQIRQMAMDRRFRPSEADKFCRAHEERCIGVVGANRPQMNPLQARKLGTKEKSNAKKRLRGGSDYLSVDTGYYKDLLARLLRDGKFKASPDASGRYHQHMNSEHRVTEEDRYGEPVHVWRVKPGSDANHFFDTEIYGMAAAAKLKYFQDPEQCRDEGQLGEVRTDWFAKQREKRRAGR